MKKKKSAPIVQEHLQVFQIRAGRDIYFWNGEGLVRSKSAAAPYTNDQVRDRKAIEEKIRNRAGNVSISLADAPLAAGGTLVAPECHEQMEHINH